MASQALKVHTSFPSFTEDLKSKAGVVPLSYSHTELSQILISNTSQPAKLTEAQRQRIKQIQEDDRDYKLQEVKAVLEEFFDILNDAFYFGQLKSRTDLMVYTEWSKDLPGDYDDVKGVCVDFWESEAEKGARTPGRLCPKDGQKPGIAICLFWPRDGPYSRAPETFSRSKLHHWIGILLHEMLHSFFETFSCACWARCHSTFTDSVEGVGFTGHGIKFCEALEAIRNKCRTETGFGDVLDCGIDLGVYEEIVHTGWEPTDSQIQRWGVDKSRAEVNKKMQEYAVEQGYDLKGDQKKDMEEWLRKNDAKEVDS